LARRAGTSLVSRVDRDLHDVREFLGHANISTTSRYLQSTPTRLEQVMARFDAVTKAGASPATTVRADGSRTIRTNRHPRPPKQPRNPCRRIQVNY
jgi:hypothetical protein